jgi:hypothetical protein
VFDKGKIGPCHLFAARQSHSYEPLVRSIVNDCHFEKIANGDHRGNHIKFSSSDEPYTILSIRNWADIELYMYARYLFVDQADLIPSPIPK